MSKNRFWTDLWWLLIFTFVGTLLTVLLTGLVTGRMGAVAALHVSQWLQTVLMFWLPACVWTVVYRKERVGEGLRYVAADWRQLALTLVLMTVSLPALDALARGCERLPLPEALAGVAATTRAAQEATLAQMLSLGGVWGWTELVMLMCVATAIAEETMFRGALLRCYGADCARWGMGRRLWVALMVGLVFSACHGDVYGLIPRWVLGMLLCYLVYWTGSLLPGMLAHALNNLWAVIEMKEAPQMLEHPGACVVAVSAGLTVVALWAISALERRAHSR